MTRRYHPQVEASGVKRDTFARWVLLALLLSLGLHGLGWSLSRKVPVESMSDSFYEQIVPRTFQVERVDIDPRLLESSPDEAAKPPVVAPVDLPDERISPLDAVGKTSGIQPLPALDDALLGEKPAIPDALPMDVPNPTSVLEEADEALRGELLRELSEAFPSTPELEISQSLGGSAESAVNASAGGLPGFSNLDELLERTGPATPATAPILLPGDVLFEYDAFELQPGAVASLEKLAQLLNRNPGARFVIEGHSDSFGPPEYNLRLSELRAESVKDWLTRRMGIDESRIQTRGLGQSRLLVPSTESVEGQQLNRRVEIVIQNNVQ